MENQPSCWYLPEKIIVTCHLKMYFLLNMVIFHCKILVYWSVHPSDVQVFCPLRAQKIWQLMPFFGETSDIISGSFTLPPPQKKKKTWFAWNMMGTMKFDSRLGDTRNQMSLQAVHQTHVCFKAVPAASGATPFRQLVTSVPPAMGVPQNLAPAMILWSTRSVDHDKLPVLGVEVQKGNQTKFSPQWW